MNKESRDELLAAIARLSQQYPNWRLGKLIANVAGWADQAIWDVADEQLLAAVHSHLDDSMLVVRPTDEMKRDAFVPMNSLEVALASVMEGESKLAKFLHLFVDCTVAVPSATEVQGDGTGMNPVVFDKEGVKMLAVFTDLQRAKSVGSVAPYCLTISGKDLLARLPTGFGIVVNPGFSVGFDISPIGVQEIRRDFCSC